MVDLKRERAAMTLPTLSTLGPITIVPLRTEKHPELKNKIMMDVLGEMDWFVEFRRNLAEYRERGGQRPVYPSTRVARIEEVVDRLIVNVMSDK